MADRTDAAAKSDIARFDATNSRHDHEIRATSSPLPARRPGRRTSLPTDVEFREFQNSWLPAYSQLLDSLYDSPGGGGGHNERADAAKIREKVRAEMERLLSAPDRPSKALVTMVDAAEQSARTAWLDEVAVHFRAVGMLLRVMHAVRTLSGAVLDAGSAYALFLAEARKLVAADEAQVLSGTHPTPPHTHTPQATHLPTPRCEAAKIGRRVDRIRRLGCSPPAARLGGQTPPLPSDLQEPCAAAAAARDAHGCAACQCGEGECAAAASSESRPTLHLLSCVS